MKATAKFIGDKYWNHGQMSTEAQKRASAKYDADNTFRITLKLNRKTDADIIQKLESEPNKNAYIKAKLRE